MRCALSKNSPSGRRDPKSCPPIGAAAAVPVAAAATAAAAVLDCCNLLQKSHSSSES